MSLFLDMGCRGKPDDVSRALGELGVVTERHDAGVRTEMAYGMFDTRGKVRGLALVLRHSPATYYISTLTHAHVVLRTGAHSTSP